MNILFPTDYSDNACNAFQYACYLAEKMKATLTLVHVYQIPILNNNLPANSLTHQREEIRIKQLNKLQDFIKDFEVHATALPLDTVTFTYKVATGNAVEGIKTVCKEANFDLIIMGTKGATNSTKESFGSNTSQLIEEVNIPVLAIPNKATYQKLENIAFAEDFEEQDKRPLHFIKKIKSLFGAHLSIMHISEVEDNANSTRKQNYNHIKHQSIRGLPDSDIVIVHGFDKVLALEEFVQEKEIDLLGMVSRNSEAKASQNSLVKKVVLRIQVPLIVFPNK